MTSDTLPLLSNPVLDRLARGEPALFMQVRLVESIEIVHIARAAGFDGFYIDMEHCTMSLRDAGQICLAALNSGIAAYVRVPGHGPEFISRVLDAGALGVFVPHVDTPEVAAEIAGLCKYPPLGHRSGSSGLPHLGFAKVPAAQTRQAVDQATQLVVMIESAKGVENIDAIAAVPGVDALHIGTADLCADLGILNQPDHPQIMEIYRQALAACHRHGKVLGVGGMAKHPELRRKMVELGARIVVTGSDHAFLLDEAARRCAASRN